MLHVKLLLTRSVDVCRVDFVVVLESLVSLVLEAVKSTSSLDISALRALRVLRPLRAITYIQQVRTRVVGKICSLAAYSVQTSDSSRVCLQGTQYRLHGHSSVRC